MVKIVLTRFSPKIEEEDTYTHTCTYNFCPLAWPGYWTQGLHTGLCPHGLFYFIIVIILGRVLLSCSGGTDVANLPPQPNNSWDYLNAPLSHLTPAHIVHNHLVEFRVVWKMCHDVWPNAYGNSNSSVSEKVSSGCLCVKWVWSRA